MAYGSVLTDTVQTSTAATAPVFKDGNGTQIGTLCRAWVNFNGTGTVAIRASFNVSSITDNGTGDYSVNFTTALPDANYSTNVTGSNGGGATGLVGFVNNNATAPTTSLVRLQLASSAFAAADASIVNVSIFR
jgi:hypothetical protein